MKKIFVIYAHFNDKSFMSAVKNTFVDTAKTKGHEIDLVDLYKIKFNPLYTGEKTSEEIISYQKRIDKSDIIVFIYPVWWFRAPSILEGFIDKIFIPPWAFEFKRIVGNYGFPRGKLKNKKAIIFNSYGSPRFATELFFMNLPIRRLKRGFLHVCGIYNVLYKRFFSVPFVSDTKRAQYIESVKRVANNI